MVAVTPFVETPEPMPSPIPTAAALLEHDPQTAAALVEHDPQTAAALVEHDPQMGDEDNHKGTPIACGARASMETSG